MSIVLTAKCVPRRYGLPSLRTMCIVTANRQRNQKPKNEDEIYKYKKMALSEKTTKKTSTK